MDKIENNIVQSEKCNTYSGVGGMPCQKIANIYIIENTTYLTKKEVKMCRSCKDRFSEYLKYNEDIYLKE